MNQFLRNIRVPVFLAILLCPPSHSVNAQDQMPSNDAAFTFETVIEMAKELAAKPFDPQAGKLTGDWLTLNYDEYRATRFLHDRALLRGISPFEVHFFHPGSLFSQMVSFSLVEGGTATQTPFNPSWYRYDFTRRPLPPYPDNMGFAGIRIHYPLNTANYKDELIVFQGSSYFRFLSKNQKYGLSARGLAVDSGMNQPEEFPFFRQFWLEKPSADAKSMLLYALLDSPRITGAYAFDVQPGEKTGVLVKEVLYTRQAIDKVGIAPLSSMFFFAENKTLLVDDFRPEVHDSDGLLLHTGGGEWVWRPLVNRQWLNNTSFVDHNPKGFGLMQRDRDFRSYEDVESFYHERPSYWIEPIGNWGGGHVELVELPTRMEINDNIVAFWVPREPVRAGQRLEYSYRITSLTDDLALVPETLGRTLQSRVGMVTRPGTDTFDWDSRIFVLDFIGQPLENLDAEAPVEGVIWYSSGRIENIVSHKNPFIKGWRFHFDFHPDGEKPADFRVYLKLGDKALTETWTYLWTPFDPSVRVLGHAAKK